MSLPLLPWRIRQVCTIRCVCLVAVASATWTWATMGAVQVIGADPDRDEAEMHWSFQPVRRPTPPHADGDDWSRNPIDRFVVQKHQRAKLGPAAEASRRTLVRRLYLNLWGLPPSWQETESFAADDQPDAVERLISRLLDSPRYGEHWGRYWLDIARWAESEGFESNHPRPFAWRYRDYVVAAFQQDKPYDEFLCQQLAGDELPTYSDENLIATGFLASARISSNEEDKWLQRNDVTVDVVNAVGTAFLGLTWHCAQCHDHKFDPFSIGDYYRLHAFFARGMPVNVRLSDPQLEKEYRAQLPAEYEPAVALKQALWDKAQLRFIETRRAELSPAERDALDTPTHLRTTPMELLARKADLRLQSTSAGVEKHLIESDRKLYDELKRRLAELDRSTPLPPQTFAFYSPVTSPHRLTVLPSIGFYPLPYEPSELASAKTYVMERGDVHQIGPEVAPGWPSILGGAEEPSAVAPRTVSTTSLTRSDLSRWLTRRDHPLVARVWVNRIWQQHFGRGLVSTCDDFGVRGARPSHPELLDWLATELMENHWSTKHIQRLILTSATFRQSAQPSGDSYSRDPDNRWLSRWSPRRLNIEVLRDACLATTGELDLRAGGPSEPIDRRETSLRRNLYLFQRRGQPADMQRLFDGPNECAASASSRYVSTSPLQSLYLLNSEFMLQRSRKLCETIAASTASRRESQITMAFREVLRRDPTTDERCAAEQLWTASDSPLELLCQALLNLNEFAYLE